MVYFSKVKWKKMCFLVFMPYLHCSYHLTASLTVTNYFSFSLHSEIGNPCVQQRMMSRSTGQTQQFARPGDFGQCHEWKTGLEPKPVLVLVLWGPLHSCLAPFLSLLVPPMAKSLARQLLSHTSQPKIMKQTGSNFTLFICRPRVQGDP